MARGHIRHLPGFLNHPIFLHVAQYTRQHAEFFQEIEAVFGTQSEEAFQTAFWKSDFGYWFMAESQLNFSSKEFYTYFRRILAEQGTTCFLDVGCGLGYLCRWVKGEFPDARVVGIDISTTNLDTARQESIRTKVDVEYYLGSGNTILERFGPRSFDTVVCTDSFQYMEDGLEVLRQMAHVAVRSLFIITPRGPLTLDDYRKLDKPFCTHDYDRSWVHPLRAYAAALNLPVHCEGPTSASCYFLDVRFDHPPPSVPAIEAVQV